MLKPECTLITKSVVAGATFGTSEQQKQANWGYWYCPLWREKRDRRRGPRRGKLEEPTPQTLLTMHAYDRPNYTLRQWREDGPIGNLTNRYRHRDTKRSKSVQSKQCLSLLFFGNVHKRGTTSYFCVFGLTHNGVASGYNRHDYLEITLD